RHSVRQSRPGDAGAAGLLRGRGEARSTADLDGARPRREPRAHVRPAPTQGLDPHRRRRRPPDLGPDRQRRDPRPRPPRHPRLDPLRKLENHRPPLDDPPPRPHLARKRPTPPKTRLRPIPPPRKPAPPPPHRRLLRKEEPADQALRAGERRKTNY